MYSKIELFIENLFCQHKRYSWHNVMLCCSVIPLTVIGHKITKTTLFVARCYTITRVNDENYELINLWKNVYTILTERFASRTLNYQQNLSFYKLFFSLRTN